MRSRIVLVGRACLVVAIGLSSPAATAEVPGVFTDGFETGDQSWWSRSEPNGSTVTGVEPDNGIDGGGDQITITGVGFSGATDVQIDGLSCVSWLVVDNLHISCETPPHEPAIVRVTVWRNDGHGTLPAGFRYTGDELVAIDWAAIQWPATLTGTVGTPTDWVYGRAHGTGVTDGEGPPGADVVAEVGYGPPATLPGRDPDWLWFSAGWFADAEGVLDEFRASLVCPASGTYAYAFRCAADGGLHYHYGDFDPGSADGLSTADLGVLDCQ